jgi:hypothetical protein
MEQELNKTKLLLINAQQNLDLFRNISTRIYCRKCNRFFIFLEIDNDIDNINIWNIETNKENKIPEITWSNPFDNQFESKAILKDIDLENFDCTCSLCVS